MKKRALRDGETLAQCDKTGLLMPTSRMRKQWNGLYVADEAYTERPPQESFVQPLEGAVPANPRPFKMRSVE